MSGSGIQKCHSDGSGYGACQCGDAGADASAGSGGGGNAGSGGGGNAGSGGGGNAGSGGASGGASGGVGGGVGGGSGGSGGSSGDAGTTCAPGTATNVTGACDLVTQNCAAGLTCRVEQTDAGGYQSACIDLGNGAKKLGESCNAHKDCQAKLSCALSKCTRPCCNDGPCGANGSCDMKISYGSSFVQVCTFSASCTPWAKDCPSGPESDCHIGANGKLKCSFPNYTTDAGSTLGTACQFLNDCQDSQQCDFASGSGVCRWLCKASGSGAPDAGAVGGTPGNGGCPSGQTCKAYSSPSWLGVCRP